MKPSPRTRRTLLAPLLACALLDTAAGQGVRPEAKQSAQKKSDAQANAQAARARRETRGAVAALKEAAELARGFEDVCESVSVQAEAAEALWPQDEQTARSVLRRAWEAANAPGAEEHVQGFGTSEDPREDAFNALTTARRFVIKAALKRDPRLGEALMREFERGLAEREAAAKRDGGPHAQGGDPAQEGAGAGESDEAAAPLRRERDLSPAGWQRLDLARQLFDEGDFRAAAGAAAPLVAEGPTPPLLMFNLNLRAHDAAGADALYLRLLAATRAVPGADANDVLLLSVPFVSPDLRVHINADGSAGLTPVQYLSAGGRAAAASLPESARHAFFDAAADVLLRARPSGGGGHSGGEAAAFYFAVGRLLPFFEREAPQLAPALNARRVSLAAEVDAARRDSLKANMEVSSLTSGNPVDPLAYSLGEVARARDQTGRDFARLLAVAHAARSALWERARGLTEEIEGAEARRAARLVVAIEQVSTAGQAYEDEGADGAERAAAFVKAADVPPEVRALGLAQAAELAARTSGRERADALLAEAAAFAAEADRGPQRAAALALVTLSAERAGLERAWELLPAFVRAADEADELRYGGMLLEFNVGTSDRKLWVSAPRAPVSLPEVFAAAARLDALKTFTEARGFGDEELRAAALLAAGRAALEKGGRGARVR